ncbi:MAG: flippase-like domain-containing protein [Planctomycetes bacterium]|nr:flippase-like domain-containing protein [Planctomycetota bacterium]
MSLLVSLAGWIPSVWFWQRLMQAMNQRVGFRDCARAHYCGHLGKYVPGKAFVLIIRSGMMKSRGFSAAAAAVTATFETLLFMGAGLAIGLALFPVTRWPPLLSEWISSPWLMPVIVVTLTAAALPLIAKLATRLAVLITPRDMTAGQSPLRISVKLIACGLAVFVVSWALLGLSLGLTIRAVSDEPLRWAHWPLWTGAVALATSVGFAAILIPGGIGVREGLLIEILRTQPEISSRQAVVASVLLRLIWLIAEILAAVVVYYGLRPRRNESDSPSPS